MKKTLIVGLTAVLALGGVVTAHADDQVTLTFAETMTSPERTLVLEDTIKAYEDDHPGVTIELVSPPYESAETKVASMLSANQDVDIVEIRDNTVGAWINNDWLYKLDDLVSDWNGKD